MYRGRGARAAEPGSPGLSTAQLRGLLPDEPPLERIVRLSIGRKFQSLQLERETCLASNYALAKENLSLQPRLENGKASLAIKYQELRETREACQEKQQRVETCLRKWSPQSALSQLQAALDAAEAESEAQVEMFLGRELPLDAFLEFFQESRMLSHLRRTQVEKLEQLLRKEKQPRGLPTCCEGQRPALLSPARAQVALVQNAASPKMFQLRYGYTPALLVPSDAIIPFPVPVAPPSRNLPPLASCSGQSPPSHSSIPCLGSPLRLIGHIPLLSPRPFRVQHAHLSYPQKQEPPHR
ncbi:vacuolar protein sorting-associated protein 37D isoform X2 [Mauremys reevesii]|uniref:vacuolar protein sorting-associated protein 37D isoform X2 n=1 Tax=Mauremys reevesii TaxID=260615 RepID=UPI00193EDB9E|nr:vacuolar protein sorting-associated protein 37D isoform X2 [Mauremys reevesii]